MSVKVSGAILAMQGKSCICFCTSGTSTVSRTQVSLSKWEDMTQSTLCSGSETPQKEFLTQ